MLIVDCHFIGIATPVRTSGVGRGVRALTFMERALLILLGLSRVEKSLVCHSLPGGGGGLSCDIVELGAGGMEGRRREALSFLLN